RGGLRRSRATIAGLLVLGSALLAGCGEPSRDELAPAVDEVCVEEAAAFEELSQSAEGTDVAAQLESGAAIREEALEALRALEAPGDLQQPFDDYLVLREENLEITRAAVEAAERGDREALDVATATLSDRTAETDLTASQLGADECVSSPAE
ncbi:MAG: hypothetical protein H0V08_04080, partial [Thermoleophilaceae bacterium]|nr:hypothetical protein [Thermoleophilaceae bacterium]